MDTMINNLNVNIQQNIQLNALPHHMIKLHREILNVREGGPE